MATGMITPQRRAVASTVAMKSVMAVSGLIMVLFLLAHMYGNLKIFSGQAAFDGYSHHLRELGEPMLPYGGALWIIRIVLILSLVGHVVSAVLLTRRDQKAVGVAGRYQSTRNRRGVQRSYASFTMRSGGVVILTLVIFHLAHLTWNVIHPGGASGSPYERVVNGFEIWWLVAIYCLFVLAVGFHFRHGIPSALTTLGLNTSTTARRRLSTIGLVFAILIVVGFLIPPFSVLFGVVQ